MTASKVILLITLIVLAWVSWQSNYIDSTVRMGHDYQQSSALVVFGTHYHPIANGTTEQHSQMQWQLFQSRVFIVIVWIAAMLVVAFWRSKPTASPSPETPSLPSHSGTPHSG